MSKLSYLKCQATLLTPQPVRDTLLWRWAQTPNGTS